MKREMCAACGCQLLTQTLEGKIECSACGSQERKRLKVTGDGERCVFCKTFPAGTLCEVKT